MFLCFSLDFTIFIDENGNPQKYDIASESKILIAPMIVEHCNRAEIHKNSIELQEI